MPSIRTFTTSHQRLSQGSEEGTKDDKKREIPPEWWIGALETTAHAPWLFHMPPEDPDKLKKAFTLIFQVIIYLGRPQEQEKATQFLAAFGSAVVPAESEIGRARRAITNIIRALVHDIEAVPESSALREQHPEVFGLFGALEPLYDMYLEEMTDVEQNAKEWHEFWSRAEPVLISLAQVLDEKGFGLEPDEKKAATRGQKKKEGENAGE
ncbi:hypothetical protein AX17_004828 [Amanita inopinata Kibby_2008]|nr:hypothetical protein AX17_004828 [Amanita inopinata Kibby_2008]